MTARTAMRYPRRQMYRRLLACALVTAVFAACHHDEAPAPRAHDARAVAAAPPDARPIDAPPPPPPVDWYRATVGKGKQEVPFFVGLPPAGTAGSCTIVNGEEHIPVDCTWTDATTIDLEFREFGNSIRAKRAADGSLAGTWKMSRITGTQAPFAAKRVDRPDPQLRFAAAAGTAPAPGDFSGTWRFQFEELDSGKGMLAQTPDGIVTGTIIPEKIGDMRYLAGSVRGKTLWLSTFDGQHAYVIRANLAASGDALEGTFVVSQSMDDTFTAKRVPSLDISMVEKIHLRKGAHTVTVPHLDDPQYRGKPVIVDYFGTWCPACLDETPYLVDLYRRRHAEGLEILSIALEATEDDAYNHQQVEYFRKHYDIPWQILVLPGDYVGTLKQMPPELEGTGGYPVTIFLDRDHTVRAVHSGFIGPAAGDDYRLMLKRYEGYVDAMLASKPPP